MLSNLIKTVSFSTLNYQKLPESHSYFVTKIKKSMPREKSVHMLMILINQEFNTIREYSKSELNYLQ